jgi:hypothetical protein
MSYSNFLQGKREVGREYGFDPVFMPDAAFDFQKDLIRWAVRKGRGALFADCGMGKTLMQLAWAENVARHSGGRVLILTPLAVSHQTCDEAAKFGIEATRSDRGEMLSQIVVTNYERLHYFDPNDFEGVVCDESSILKNFDGATKKAVTDFMQTRKYRLLCTATAAPNDWIELGTSAEALGVMKRVHMMAHYFNHDGGETSKWRLKRHAEDGPFWQWISSWARTIRRPSDLGYPNGDFILPELVTRQHVVDSSPSPDLLFPMPAVGLIEQREERRRSLNERCEVAAELVNEHDRPVVAWCHLNVEGDRLADMIPGAVQVSGSDRDEVKEDRFRAFEAGEIRVMVTKPTIAGFGLNWQHCAHQTFFPSHSFEQWYQAVRRCWRFGQENDVVIDVITSEGEQRVLANLQHKAKQADEMFENLIRHTAEYQNDQKVSHEDKFNQSTRIPEWL